MKDPTRSASTKKPDRARKSYYVYLLLCDDGSYYTGYTNNVASRLERHKKGHGARYTRMRKPQRVAYVEKFRTRAAAIRREHQIKSLSHREKHELGSIWSRTNTELND
ncbi:MAG: GIY-YIG nuclease family protein [Candidatus Bathyarchaeia archaeon]|jgi:putative endonuclease